MTRSGVRKNSMIVPFMAAFVGMLVAIPVAVAASVMVAKASLGEGQAQLAYAMSELNRRYEERPLATPASTSYGSECVGKSDMEEIKAEREHKSPTIVYVPTYRDRAPQPNHTPNTINNVTTTTTTHNQHISDSIITKNIDSHNTGSKNNSNNTNSGNHTDNTNNSKNNSDNTANLAGRDVKTVDTDSKNKDPKDDAKKS